MPFFKRRRPVREPSSTQPKVTKKCDQLVAKQFERTWRRLQRLCPDPDSQQRLAWLQQQFAKKQRGAMESAQAELDIATLLANAGFSLSFVKETETATADLECYLADDRLFVEVTVIVPTDPDHGTPVKSFYGLDGEDEDGDFFKDAFVKRMLARINEKSVQLAAYCAPVLLALTIVHQDRSASASGKLPGRKMALDLQQLGSVMTRALAGAPQLSGMLVTLWNIQPAESRSPIRLSNMSIGEWVTNGKGRSQVRSLMLNPAADYPVEPHAHLALQRVL